MPTRIETIRADITTLEVDAIVNAANQRMLGGGGVDGAIHRRAGARLLDACRAIPEVRPGVRCPTGEARITPAFGLPARYIIHTVGPVWEGGGAGEPELLAACYRSAITLAAAHECRSVAFPAISCGVYGYPAEEACEIAVRVLRDSVDARQAPTRIVLCAFDASIEAAYRRLLEGAKPPGGGLGA